MLNAIFNKIIGIPKYYKEKTFFSFSSFGYLDEIIDIN